MTLQEGLTQMTEHSAASGLAAKLAELDLEDEEAALLGAVFALARASTAAEVDGFGSGLSTGFGFGLNVDASGARNLFPSRNQHAGFKGSDEELHAIVDWLGSLEYK